MDKKIKTRIFKQISNNGEYYHWPQYRKFLKWYDINDTGYISIDDAKKIIDDFLEKKNMEEKIRNSKPEIIKYP